MDFISHERGRKKLMLKLPALRAQLQSLSHPHAEELFESYDLATTALERFSSDLQANGSLIAEYRQICIDLEAEARKLCATP